MELLSSLSGKLLRRCSHIEPEAEDSDRPGWRLVLRRTGFARLMVAVVLVLGGIWLFLGILEDILSKDPPGHRRRGAS